MATNPTFKKREKERARQERQREKDAKRKQRREDKKNRVDGQPDDDLQPEAGMDIAPIGLDPDDKGAS
jgi:hypothetical protein